MCLGRPDCAPAEADGADVEVKHLGCLVEPFPVPLYVAVFVYVLPLLSRGPGTNKEIAAVRGAAHANSQQGMRKLQQDMGYRLLVQWGFPPPWVCDNPSSSIRLEPLALKVARTVGPVPVEEDVAGIQVGG